MFTNKQIKYVVLECVETGEEELIVFPKHIEHDRMLNYFRRGAHKFSGLNHLPISAGFIYEGKCHGESISLDLKSREKEDTELLKELLTE